MSIYMHIQNLVRFYKVFLKIMRGNKIMTELQNDRQPKSNIAPTFSKRGYSNDKKDSCEMT